MPSQEQHAALDAERMAAGVAANQRRCDLDARRRLLRRYSKPSTESNLPGEQRQIHPLARDPVARRMREPDVDEVGEEQALLSDHVAAARDEVELGVEERVGADLTEQRDVQAVDQERGPFDLIESNVIARDSPVVAGSPRALMAVESGSPMNVHESGTIPSYSSG